jgi:hypothetical protein
LQTKANPAIGNMSNGFQKYAMGRSARGSNGFGISLFAGWTSYPGHLP